MTVLGREPDEAGLTHYVRQLEAGASLADIERSLTESDECRARGASAKSR
jgi:hypothetical protein